MNWLKYGLGYVYTLRLIGLISYLGACYIRVYEGNKMHW